MRGYKDPIDHKYYGMRCASFHQCPICYKCMGPAGAFVKCDNCIAYKCHHTERDRELMIRRENFAITVTDPDIIAAFKALGKKADNNE
jgi:hypothetical protein